MNKVKFLVAAILSVLFVACSEEENLSQTSKAGFQISLTESVKVDSRSTPAELGKPLISQFNLKITNQVTERESYNGSYKDFISAAAGMYTIEAECGDDLELALDNPYYKGSVENVTLENGESKSVKVICTVANALASVVFDNSGVDSFDEQFSSYEVKVKVGTNSTMIGNNGKSAYYRAGSKPTFTFVGTLKNGTPIEEVPLEDAKLSESETFGAGQHCVITLKLREANSGAHVEISKVEVDKATINETIPMEWLPKPKVEAEGFDENKTLTFVETEQKQAALNLNLSSALQDMKFKFNFQDEQFAALDKEKTYQLSVAEDKVAIETALATTLPNVGDKPESIDLSNLLAKLQTNAGVTTTNTIEIDVKANNRWSSEAKEGEEASNLKYTLTCNKPEFSIAVQPENCWSREFTVDEVTVSGNADAEKIKANLKYQYYNGTDWVDCTTREAVVGRTQQFADAAEDIATKIYKVRALYRGTIASDEVEATLETPMQLPNSNMEDWDTERGEEFRVSDSWGTKKTYYKFYPYKNGETDIWWATNNQHSQDGNIVLGLGHPVAFAPCVSYSEDVKHEDYRSALIYTSGHGDGSNSTAEMIYEKNAFAGSLFIGKDENTKGHDFSVRPSAFEFWYKYQPKNEDQFKVYIELKNGDEIIASGEFIPTASSSDTDWVKGTISIPYPEDAKIATSIYIQFLSTTKTSFSKSDFDRNKSFSFPMMPNWHVHMGSMLYIDDLNLVYDK